MNFKSCVSAIVLVLLATSAYAANEPHAGAFVRKENNVAPKAESKSFYEHLSQLEKAYPLTWMRK